MISISFREECLSYFKLGYLMNNFQYLDFHLFQRGVPFLLPENEIVTIEVPEIFPSLSERSAFPTP